MGKRIYTLFILFISAYVIVHAENSLYNGKLLSREEPLDGAYEIRLHHQTFKIDPFFGYSPKQRDLYIEPSEKGSVIGQIENGTVSTLATYEKVVKVKTSYDEVYYKTESWVLIVQPNGNTGWCKIGMDNGLYYRFGLPSKNPGSYGNNWIRIGEINIDGRKTWTLRTYENEFCVAQEASKTDLGYVFKVPGDISKSNRLCEIKQLGNFVYTTCATDEKQSMQGFSGEDRWVKIKQDKTEGWIWGGILYAERGGPKFTCPEDLLDWYFNWSY